MYPETLTLSSVGQLTLPKSVRNLLGLSSGDKVKIKVNQKAGTITLKKQPTTQEIFAELKRQAKNRPAPDPRAKHMTVGEMSLEQAKKLKGDTWV
ncbi:AbrB/MazE/SpoVT family DNA-binding domain-containing protein [Candidatus Saccharibacteria bacterium]|nr:AbrB/MazE/SpoVT family DNA-binding domain-containing protein [Candidatus Saccharibacteria bacterium]